MIEKKIATEDGKEQTAWSLYFNDNIGQIEDYPAYPYMEFYLYLYTSIMAPEIYAQLFHIMRNTNVGDEFHIYINSPGGDMSTLCSFSAVIEDTDATVICHIDGEADSAAFILAFMGDQIIFSEFSQMMTHNQRLGISGTDMANLLKFTQNSTSVYRNMLEKYCSKVLTKQEINDICMEGKEIHFTAEECANRLKKWEDAKKDEKNDNDTNRSDEHERNQVQLLG